MSIEHLEGPTPAPSYRGFSGQPMDEPPPKARRDFRPLMIAGVAAAAALGIGLGFWANPPELGAPEPKPMRAAAQAEPQVRIAMNPQPPEPPLEPGAPMEVLPPQMAAAPRAMALGAPVADAAPTPAPPAPARPPPVVAMERPISPPAPRAAPPTLARLEPPRAPPPMGNEPAFDCGGRLSPAQALVCSDARLSAKDRRLARAYRDALRAGVPAESLAAEQDDWRAIREDAADVSPRAVAQVYDQRIRELEEMGDWSRDEE